jgi:hypothetical protein
MTGRQEYDRTKDRQRILDEYMIDKNEYQIFLVDKEMQNGAVAKS